MRYIKQDFKPGEKLYAKDLNEIDDQLYKNTEDIGTLQATISDQNDKIDNITVGTFIDYDANVKAVNHRGYSAEAPENTIPAYILSKQKGFKYVECDVSFTSDGVAVLLHDATIDRTSDGSGNINSLTYAQVLQYDFGSWKNSKYTGTKIPTFEEFIMTCKAIGLHPYIELKSSGGYTQEQITGIVDMVESCGMKGKVTYISFNETFLEYVKTADSKARLGYLADVTDATIATANGLKTEENEVFMDVSYSNITEAKVSKCIENELPLEIWTVNNQSVIENMNNYVTGVTSDNLISGKILYNKYMTYTPVEPEEPTDKTLSSISATYNGGNVEVGTSVSSLTGITVTAHYSDGTNSNVTGYTLTGTIVEGNNTITVSYGGKTTTFIVVGIASENIDLTSGLVYDLDFSTYSTDGTITNKGSSTDEITIVNTSNTMTSDSDGAIVLGYNDSVSVPFVIDQDNNGAVGGEDYTWAVKVKNFTLSGNTYERVMRGNNDAPSVYVHKASSNLHGKTVFNAKMLWQALSATAEVLTDSEYYVGTNDGTNGACFELTKDMWFIFTLGGRTGKFYINDELSATQDISGTGYSPEKDATSIGIGNTDTSKHYAFNSLTVSDFKVWSRSLTESEISVLVSEDESGGDIPIIPDVDTGDALYYWDFTNNLTDSVNGVVATTNATKQTNGIKFSDTNQYIKLGESSYNMKNKTVEIDVDSMTIKNTSQYKRLFAIVSTNSTATNSGASALVCGSNKPWQLYTGNAWTSAYGDFADDYFSGKTVQLYFDDDMYCHLYIDGASYGKSSSPSNYSDGWLVIGGSNNDYLSYLDTVISGVRIYEGNKNA